MTDLITLDEYKAYVGKSKTDDDGKITFLISSVSALIKAYVGHSIIDNWEEPIVEDIYTPYDANTLYLPAHPVRDIISVEEVTGGWMGGLDSTIHYPLVFNSDYTFNVSNGYISRVGGTWNRHVRVTYRAGFAQTPAQVKLAAIELVRYYMDEGWKPNRTMQGANMAGPVAEADGIPKHIAVMLDHYKVGI